ncbi:MAG: dimethyl sulfoxide reductase anchor subunit family protein [Acidiferrobacterales bacterium]
MRPAFSVIFLTTLIGAGQGVFLSIFTVEVYSSLGLLPMPAAVFFDQGSSIAAALLVAGLLASFFHLGHPERAWRSAAMWRTSWLSREVIVLPAVTVAVALYGLVHHFRLTLGLVGIHTPVPNDLSLLIGAGGVVVAIALFLCTGMIYACIRFLQEWATWLTVANYTLFGLASGFVLASAIAAYTAPGVDVFLATWATILTAAALVTRTAALIRNARIKHKSSLQTAIGVRHGKIVQKSQGFMGGSFNTREFFHGASVPLFRSIKWVFLVLVFPVPITLLWAGFLSHAPGLIVTAFAVQYLGLIMERWFFFAQANHPQNLYYQVIS